MNGRSVLVAIGLLAAGSAHAADQTQIGAGNRRAEQIGQQSPLVRSAIELLEDNARRITDATIRESTLDSFLNRDTCVRHRAGVTDAVKNQIIASLVSQGLVNPADATSITGGLKAAVFPPLVLDGTPCPHLPLSFAATPGSSFEGHHSYPGGLAVHEFAGARRSIETIGRVSISGQSAFTPEDFTTWAHLSVSSAISMPNSPGDPGRTVPPKSAMRDFNL